MLHFGSVIKFRTVKIRLSLKEISVGAFLVFTILILGKNVEKTWLETQMLPIVPWSSTLIILSWLVPDYFMHVCVYIYLHLYIYLCLFYVLLFLELFRFSEYFGIIHTLISIWSFFVLLYSEVLWNIFHTIIYANN